MLIFLKWHRFNSERWKAIEILFRSLPCDPLSLQHGCLHSIQYFPKLGNLCQKDNYFEADPLKGCPFEISIIQDSFVCDLIAGEWD